MVEHGIEIHWTREQVDDLTVTVPVSRIANSGPLFQPHVFLFPGPEDRLAMAGVKVAAIPPVTGPQLARLRKADGREERENRARHGIVLKKRFS